jgi:alanine dehydrogenase
MDPIYITYLNRLDVEELKLTNDEILDAIETALAVQGRGEAVIEPRMHLEPKVANGHFNVLRGALKPPVDLAGVKVVGDFVDNYTLGYPSELAVLLLMDPRMGAPRAILDASGITDMRTGAVTAIGAKYLARKNSKILGHIGARGTA